MCLSRSARDSSGRDRRATWSSAPSCSARSTTSSTRKRRRSSCRAPAALRQQSRPCEPHRERRRRRSGRSYQRWRGRLRGEGNVHAPVRLGRAIVRPWRTTGGHRTSQNVTVGGTPLPRADRSQPPLTGSFGAEPARRAAGAAARRRSTTSSRTSAWCFSCCARAGSRSPPCLGRVAAGRVLAPLGEVAQTAQHITDTEDLTSRIQYHADDEVGQLADPLQRDDRAIAGLASRARRVGARAASARGRRLTRAAHSDHEPAHEHRGADGRRRALGG